MVLWYFDASVSCFNQIVYLFKNLNPFINPLQSRLIGDFWVWKRLQKAAYTFEKLLQKTGYIIYNMK
jgi:hypothetical protein